MTTIRVPLYGRAGIVGYTLVDAVDFDSIRRYRWHRTGRGYARRTEYLGGGRAHRRYRAILMHRVIVGLTDDDPREVDHIDGNRLNNRRSNLRMVNRAANSQNRSGANANNRHGFRGVSRRPNGRWQAYGTVAGRRHYLGVFGTAEEAAAVARRWRDEHLPYSVER